MAPRLRSGQAVGVEVAEQEPARVREQARAVAAEVAPRNFAP
ncbi:MAG: hypothetical protein AAB642_00170 [Patescibacteria group bacterium]